MAQEGIISAEAYALEQLAKAIGATFTSPNVLDANQEAANVVDALDRVAQGLFALAAAIRSASGTGGNRKAP